VRDAGETAYGIGYKDAQGRLLNLVQFRDKVLANQGNIVLIARNSNYQEWIPFLPHPKTIADNGSSGYIWATF